MLTVKEPVRSLSTFGLLDYTRVTLPHLFNSCFLNGTNARARPLQLSGIALTSAGLVDLQHEGPFETFQCVKTASMPRADFSEYRPHTIYHGVMHATKFSVPT